jgi:hypothetical protein
VHRRHPTGGKLAVERIAPHDADGILSHRSQSQLAYQRFKGA